METKRKRKTIPRGCGSLRFSSNVYDLNVPLVLASNAGGAASVSLSSSNKKKAKSTIWKGPKDELVAIIKRLDMMGFSYVALSTVVHGQVKQNSEESMGSVLSDLLSSIKKSKKRRLDDESSEQKQIYPDTRIRILKRLTVIVDHASDLIHYSQNVDEKMKEILKSYDIIALLPRNETVFKAICNSKSLFYSDIIMLDYTAGRGGVQMPFRVKQSDISSATSMGLSFEICYAVSIIDPSKRKAFIQTARQFLSASLSVTKPQPRLILASGCRVLDGRDFGAMTLRSPADMSNICNVMLGLPDTLISKLMTINPLEIVQRGSNRKIGKVCRLNLTFKVLEDDKISHEEKPKTVPNLSHIEDSSESCEDEDKNNIEEESGDVDLDDGFLTLS